MIKCYYKKRLLFYITYLLIEETLAQQKNIKYFSKIDIYQVFYQIKMFKNSKKLTTFVESLNT